MKNNVIRPHFNLATLDHHLSRYMSKYQRANEATCQYITPKGFFILLPMVARTIVLS